MPIKKASKKDLKQSRAKYLKNQLLRKQLHWLFQQVNFALKKGDAAEAKKIVIQFQKTSDKLAKNHVITQQFANRKKAVLMRALATPKTS
jgi:ribosomal protein S20